MEVGPLNWTHKHKSVWDGPASNATGHAPGPRAIGPCRRRTTGQRLGEPAKSIRRPLRTPACVARGDFFEVGNFAPFSKFLHIKGRNFPDVFIRSRLPMTPMNDEKLHGNRSACFWEIRKTHAQTWWVSLPVILDLTKPPMRRYIIIFIQEWHVLEGSHSFTCYPHVYPRIEWTILPLLRKHSPDGATRAK